MLCDACAQTNQIGDGLLRIDPPHWSVFGDDNSLEPPQLRSQVWAASPDTTSPCATDSMAFMGFLPPDLFLLLTLEVLHQRLVDQPTLGAVQFAGHGRHAFFDLRLKPDGGNAHGASSSQTNTMYCKALKIL
jgi:hypothetical protein